MLGFKLIHVRKRDPRSGDPEGHHWMHVCVLSGLVCMYIYIYIYTFIYMYTINVQLGNGRIHAFPLCAHNVAPLIETWGYKVVSILWGIIIKENSCIAEAVLYVAHQPFQVSSTCSTVPLWRGHFFPKSNDDVIKWKHFPCHWSFVWGIHRSPMNSPHKGQWRGALMFSLICVWINGWVNNREAGDLRSYHAHNDVTVMFTIDTP